MYHLHYKWYFTKVKRMYVLQSMVFHYKSLQFVLLQLYIYKKTTTSPIGKNIIQSDIKYIRIWCSRQRKCII